jgi:flotillin
VRAEEIQIEVIERQKQIQVQEQEALRRERELEATIRKPAEAEQYRIRTIAEAERFSIEAHAAGEAEAIRIRGEAEASAIQAKGLAEAEAMKQKAAAWQNYNQAALIQQLIEALPSVAEAVASPLAQTDRIVVISNGDGAGAGASKISGDIASIIAQVPATVEALTGMNLTEAIGQLPGMLNGTPQPANGHPTAPSAEVPKSGE